MFVIVYAAGVIGRYVYLRELLSHSGKPHLKCMGPSRRQFSYSSGFFLTFINTRTSVHSVGFCNHESAEDAAKRRSRKRYTSWRFAANLPVLQADNHTRILKDA